MEILGNTVKKNHKRCLFLKLGTFSCFLICGHKGLFLKCNEWSVWGMKLNSSLVISLSTFRPNSFSHCVFGRPHTRTPAASQHDKDFRFFYFLWRLNPASRLPRIHSRTATPPCSTANSAVALSHMNVHQGEVEPVALWYQHLFSSGERSVSISSGELCPLSETKGRSHHIQLVKLKCLKTLWCLFIFIKKTLPFCVIVFSYSAAWGSLQQRVQPGCLRL